MNRRKFIGATGAALAAASAGAISRPQQMTDVPDEEQKELKLRFLGTGAADWNGRDERGELRRLTSALLDNRILIDFTPTDEDMLPAGCKPEVIFYTHSHSDHYNPYAALKAGVKRVYLSSTWFDAATADFQKASKDLQMEMPLITPLYIGQQVCECGITFTPLPANHATGRAFEQALIYLIEKHDVRLLYATDTGGIPAIASRIAGIDAHTTGKPITALVMEATMGMEYEIDYRIFTHSSVAEVSRTVKVLEKTSRYTPKDGQPVYLTHMARTLHGTQAELDAKLPKPLKAAYDGLEVCMR